MIKLTGSFLSTMLLLMGFNLTHPDKVKTNDNNKAWYEISVACRKHNSAIHMARKLILLVIQKNALSFLGYTSNIKEEPNL